MSSECEEGQGAHVLGVPLGPLMAAPDMGVPTQQAGRDSSLAVSDTLAQAGATPASQVPGTAMLTHPTLA